MSAPIRLASSLAVILLSLANTRCSSSDSGGGSGAGGTSGSSTAGGSAGTGGGSGGSTSGGAGGTGGSAAGSGGSSGSSGGAAGNAGTGGAAGGAGVGGGGTAGNAGSGGDAGSGGSSGGDAGSGGSGGSDAFTLSSPNHSEGAVFADKYTCAAAGFEYSLSPALQWTPGPEGTQSYAITFIDVTLTEGTPSSDLGYHWVIYDIPATVTSLPEELKAADLPAGARQSGDYLGPCPSFQTQEPPHTYEFTIYALATPTLSVTGTGIQAVKDAAGKLEASHLEQAKLTGTSTASPP